MKIPEFFKQFKSDFLNFKPGPKIKSIFWASVILISILLVLSGFHSGMRFHPVFSSLLFMLIGWSVSLLAIFIFYIIKRITHRLPISGILAFIGVLIPFLLILFIAFPWPKKPLLFLVLGGIVSFSLIIYSLINQKSRIVSILNLTFGLTILGLGANWVFSEGYPDEMDILQREQTKLRSLDEEGNFKTTSFYYGSGSDSKRPEFRDSIKYRTSSVNAENMLKDWKGKKKKHRENYWGFGIKELPLNGRVRMPEGEGPFPLVLIVHGNHSMTDYSDGGYEYLTHLFASHGYIGVSVDENFLNGHWSGDFRGKEMPSRAWILLKHLEQWKSWNLDSLHDLYGKINLENIVLIGHSRGGEAVSIASVFNNLNAFPDNLKEEFNFHFGIKGIISIAPTDYRYVRKMYPENINYLSIQGNYDSDESSFWGFRTYNRLKFTDGMEHFKAAVLIHGANHGQFNSSWGRKDFGPPANWLMNVKPIIPREDQEMLAKQMILSFLKSTFESETPKENVFDLSQTNESIFSPYYTIMNYQKSNFVSLADFEEDIDPTSARKGISVSWEYFDEIKELQLRTRDGEVQDNNALFVSYDYGDEIRKDSIASLVFKMDSSTCLNYYNNSNLYISVAADESFGFDSLNTINNCFEIHLKDNHQKTVITNLCTSKRLSPAIKTKLGKTKSFTNRFGKEWEVQLESFQLNNLVHFKDKSDFNFSNVTEISLVFNQNKKAAYYIDNIGIDTLSVAIKPCDDMVNFSN